MWSDVKTLLKDKSAEIVDARSAERFAGKVPEPRPGLRSGHIPGAPQSPLRQLFNKDGTLKSPREIERLFEEADVDLGKPVVTSCGSGPSPGRSRARPCPDRASQDGRRGRVVGGMGRRSEPSHRDRIGLEHRTRITSYRLDRA